MNTVKRQEIINTINKVGVIVWIELEILDSVEMEERQLTLDELTDREIVDIKGMLLFGETKGFVLTEDRGCKVNWFKK